MGHLIFIKKINSLIVVSITFILLISSCSHKHEEDLGNKLKQFYSYYFYQMEKMPLNNGINQDTLNKYFSRSFLGQIDTLADKCDCDPITQSQDYSSEITKNIVVDIKKDGRKVIGNICFPEYKYAHYCLQVQMEKENDEWKIVNVIRQE